MQFAKGSVILKEASYSLLHYSDGLKIPMPPHRGERARRSRSESFGDEIPRSADKSERQMVLSKDWNAALRSGMVCVLQNAIHFRDYESNHCRQYEVGFQQS